MNGTYWDSFDCQIQCDELIPDWYEASVEDVTVDDIPLDGHYLDHMIEDLPF